MTPSGALAALRIVLVSLTASVGAAGALIRGILTGRVTGSVSAAGAMVRGFFAALSGLVTFGYNLPGQLYFGQAYLGQAGSWAEAGLLTKQTQRGLSGASGTAGALTGLKVYLQALAGTIASAGTLTRVIARQLSGSVATAGTIAKRIAKFLAGVFTAGASLTSRTIGQTTCQVAIAGTDKTDYVRKGSLEVEDVLNDAPNRCTFICADFAPSEGQVVRVTRSAAATVEFAGHVLAVRQFYEGILANVAYHVTCQDYTWKFDRRLVTKRWTNVSATTIANEIRTGFTTGFTGTNVVAALATIPEFECVLEPPSRAMTRLCAEFAGNWYIDYDSDLHVFVTEATAAPDDISDATLATTTARGLAHMGDLKQARTRVTGKGGITSAGENIAASATSLPIEDASMFEAAGGSFLSGPNIGAYTGRHVGGTAGTVAGNVTSPGASAPSAAVASGVVGVLVGNYAYKVAFGNSQGETIPGSASNTATGVAFAAPGAASVAASGVVGKLLGVYLYVVTYVTSLGETTAGTAFGRTAAAVAAPGALTVGAGSTIGQLIGAYGYKVTFKTPNGETAAGALASRTAAATTAPTAPGVAAVSSTIGNLIGAYGYKTVPVSAFGASAASTAGTRTAAAQPAPSAPTCSATSIGPLLGTYYYKVAYVGPDGRETLGSASSAYTHAGSTATTPVCTGTVGGGLIGRGRVAWRHPIYGESAWSAYDAYDGVVPVYFTATGLPSGCTWVAFYTGAYTGGAEASASYYRGSAEYTSTGAQDLSGITGSIVPNGAGLMGGNCSLSSIPTGPSGTVARRIYRTRAGGGSGGSYYLVGELGDNSTTTYADVVPDAALTIAAPSQNLNGEQHTVSSIATGPTGTTARDIYRTEAGGSTYYFLRRIGDNTTTSFTDNATDAELDKGQTAPATATMGDQHALTGIPTGPSGTLSRVIYRTAAGGSIYYRLVEIGDNSTTSFTDNVADAALGADVAPSVSTAGGEQHSLTFIPTGPTGTLARRIYRTQAGASAYQFVGELTDNVATSFADNMADATLGGYVPLVNTAGANKIAVSGIPTGGTGVTKRILYRTEAGGTVYKYVATLNDNTTTTYTDNTPDTSLGREALTVGTIGAQAADTTLTLESVTGFPALGWVHADSQLIYYGAISGTTLTGIPASGAGAILSPIRGGLSVVTAPFLSGVTGITWAIEKGAPVRLYVQRNDAAAQTALAALEGGDGIHEASIDDASILTVAGLNAACDAELAAYSTKLRSITFRSRDPLLRTGKTITLGLGAPTSQSGAFLIQRVISTEFDTTEGLMPMRDVIAAPVLVSFQDVLRRARNVEAGR